MKKEQDKLRCEVKELKWKYDISYKEMSELLDMKYNSFINFVHGYKDLGYGRAMKLKEIIMNKED